MRQISVLALVVSAIYSPVSLADSSPKPIANFHLKDTVGKKWSLDDFQDRKATVFLFLGTQCPINNAYVPRLVELYKEYGPKGVQFLAINSNEYETQASIAAHAQTYKIPFPVLRDQAHLAADLLGAKRTPEAVILDSKRQVRYQGRIDDQFGIGFQRKEPTRRDLAEALNEVLAGKKVKQATTPVAGCIISRKPRPKDQGTLTFAKDISRIMQNHCQECHRPGQIGPMPLLTYEDASSWAEMIREVVSEKRMPPWLADPKHGNFRNNRSLSKEQRETLLSWIDQGCPKGDDKDLPQPKKFADGWFIGLPDAVFTMPKEFVVPAKADKNGLQYQYFEVSTHFKDDVWIQAAEAKPGNRAVVHHIIVYIATKGKRAGEGEDGIGNGYLVAYAPGDLGVIYPPGAAKKIPKGAKLVFQVHYTPNGTESADLSSVALIFAKEPPQNEVRTRGIAQESLLIPAGKDNHRVTSTTVFDKDVTLWTLFPHMHLRGKSFEYRVVYPDGKSEILLSIPNYDFNWQGTYVLEKPLFLKKGSRIDCTAFYDNSKNNPNNPDPTKAVRWGDQTWEEMMIGFIDYTVREK
jgi:peroxiredoxin